MKTVLLSLALVLSSASAMAAGSARGPIRSCSDTRLMAMFSTSTDAAEYCGRLSNRDFTVGATYDYDHAAYTCSCYQNDDNGQNGGGNQSFLAIDRLILKNPSSCELGFFCFKSLNNPLPFVGFALHNLVVGS